MDRSLDTLHSAFSALLAQGITLCESLTDEQYREAHPEMDAAGIGGHYRHTLEHFIPLLDASTNGTIDYDARERDSRLETERAFALERSRLLLRRVGKWDPAALNEPVHVRCSVSSDPESPVVPSSLAREVMYAEIHAVHHYAIIRMLCTLMGVSLPREFGVAPSTLNHRKAARA